MLPVLVELIRKAHTRCLSRLAKQHKGGEIDSAEYGSLRQRAWDIRSRGLGETVSLESCLYKLDALSPSTIGCYCYNTNQADSVAFVESFYLLAVCRHIRRHELNLETWEEYSEWLVCTKILYQLLRQNIISRGEFQNAIFPEHNMKKNAAKLHTNGEKK